MPETKPICPTCGAVLVDLRTQDDSPAGWACTGNHAHWFPKEPEPRQPEESFPLISVITPTRNRRDFIPQLCAGFLSQDWPNKELVIVWDGEDIDDALPIGHGYVQCEPGCECSIFRVHHESTLPHAAGRIGEALNVGIRKARGMYCVRFDDDDWQSPVRLSQQVAMLSMTGKGVVAGSSGLFLTESGEAFEYTGQPWQASGFSHAFVREYALQHPYPEDGDGETGEDLRFIADAYRLGELCTVSGMDWVVARDHQSGTSGSRFSGPGQGENDPLFQMVDGDLIINLRKSDNWKAVPFERIAGIVPGVRQ